MQPQRSVVRFSISPAGPNTVPADASAELSWAAGELCVRNDVSQSVLLLAVPAQTENRRGVWRARVRVRRPLLRLVVNGAFQVNVRSSSLFFAIEIDIDRSTHVLVLVHVN